MKLRVCFPSIGPFPGLVTGYGGEYCQGPLFVAPVSNKIGYDTGVVAAAPGTWTFIMVSIDVNSLSTPG